MGGCLRPRRRSSRVLYGWPARLCSASISPAATQVPPFFHNMQKKSLSHEYQRHSACFIPLWRTLYRTETRVNIRRMSGDRSDAQSVIHPLCALCLSQTHSRSLKMNSSPAQNRGTRRVQRLKFNTDRGNKKPTYRRKIKINPSESAGGFSLRGVVVISPSVSVFVFFFLTMERE